jgi:phosphatidylinositol alpha-1,6-mannosyltransferase
LSLGRLVARKGQDTVLRALPELLRQVPNLVYVIAGKGSDQARLEALAGELGVAPHVRFVGFVPEADLAAAYRSADVYAMIAREADDDLEGFGMTYLEANSAARPVVGGRSGGTEDAIVDGATGILVDPVDPQAAGQALLSLLADPARGRAIGAAGRRRVESEMSRHAMVKALLSRLEQRQPQIADSPPRAR